MFFLNLIFTVYFFKYKEALFIFCLLSLTAKKANRKETPHASTPFVLLLQLNF